MSLQTVARTFLNIQKFIYIYICVDIYNIYYSYGIIPINITIKTSTFNFFDSCHRILIIFSLLILIIIKMCLDILKTCKARPSPVWPSKSPARTKIGQGWALEKRKGQTGPITDGIRRSIGCIYQGYIFPKIYLPPTGVKKSQDIICIPGKYVLGYIYLPFYIVI